MGLIYGNSILLEPNQSEMIFENVQVSSYDTFLEACFDSSYFLESISERFEIGFVNEAESKFNFKNMIDTLLKKIKDLWDTFIGNIKSMIESFQKKMREWHEKHNLKGAIANTIMKGLTLKDIEAADDKYFKASGRHLDFFKPKWDTGDIWGYSEQLYGIRKLFSEKEINTLRSRINNMRKLSIGDAKQEYAVISDNIKELKEKIKSIDFDASKEERKLKNRNDELEEKKKKMANFLSREDIPYYHYYAHTEFDDYFEETKRISKKDLDSLVELIQNSVSNINKIKDMFFKQDNYYSIKRIKKEIDDCTKNIKSIKSVDNKYIPRFTTPNTDYNYTRSGNTPETIDNDAKYGFEINNSEIDLLKAKLGLQLLQVEMQVSLKAYRLELKTIKTTSNIALSGLLGCLAGIKLINNKNFDIESGKYNGKIIKDVEITPPIKKDDDK